MIFTEPRFLLFFALVFAAHWSLRHHGARKHLLLVASCVFYACWEWRCLGLILGCATVDFVAGLGIARARRAGRSGKGWLYLSLAYDLGTLGFFKYHDFFADAAATLLRVVGLPTSDWTLGILLPVGISFFTFQAMSYTVDVYRGHQQPVRSYPDFLLFVMFFPQLVAGPILRASQFLPQLATPRRFADVDVVGAVGQFLCGFFKKAVVADLLSGPADAVFAEPAAYRASSIVVAACCYSTQVYCDFSGYSDMALGSARLLGYQLTRNFDHPYLGGSMREFWRRWHMSLSGWLRDHVYLPLGGSRHGRWRTYRNLLVTMLLCGLWHGARWNFLVWGAIHGTALVVHKEWTRRFGEGRLPFVAPVLTMYVVVLAQIFFRGQDLSTSWTMAETWLWLASPGTERVAFLPMLSELGIWVRFALVFGPLLGLHVLTRRGAGPWLRAHLPAPVVAFGLGLWFGASLWLMPLQARPFVYFQF